jgi:peptide/nickel transport system permease protein
MVMVALLAPFITPHPEDVTGAIHFEKMYQAPSLEHPFGTDEAGRDVLSRVIFGSKISLMLGFIVLSVAVGLGVPIGLFAGYLGGWVELVFMRLTDIFLAIPSIVLALVVSAVLSPSLENSMFAIAFSWWPWYARLAYGETLSIKKEDFVEAAESIGVSPLRIMIREILPNIFPVLIVKITLDMGYAILTGAALGFLGLGAQPPTPEWGTLISIGRNRLPEIWWTSTFPGIAIFLTVMGFNLFGDGLRDFFDVETEAL